MPKTLRMTRRLVFTALSAYWLLLAISTHIPSNDFGVELPGDKLLHCTAFAGLSFLLSWSIMRRSPAGWQVVLVLAIALTYGALDEYTQRWVPPRSPDPKDWIADACGTGVGLVAYFISWQLLRMLSRTSVRSWSARPLPANDAA